MTDNSNMQQNQT